MPEHDPINVDFPLNGVHRAFSYDQQPPGSAVDARNVRPEGPFSKRHRGGNRPPLHYEYQGLGGTAYTTNSGGAGAPTGYDGEVSTVNADTIAVTTLTSSTYQSNNTTIVVSPGGEFTTANKVVGSTIEDDTSGVSGVIINRIDDNTIRVRGDVSAMAGACTIYPFNSSMVDGWITFPSGNMYRIAGYTDGNTVTVYGNAELETTTGELIVSNEAVNMLAEINRALYADSVVGQTTTWYEDWFQYDANDYIPDGSGWTEATWMGAITDPFFLTDFLSYRAIQYQLARITNQATVVAMYRDKYNPLPDIAKDQIIDLDIELFGWTTEPDPYVGVIFRLNDDTPDVSAQGVKCTLTFEKDTGRSRATTIQQGGSTPIETAGPTTGFDYDETAHTRGVLSVRYRADDKNVDYYWNGELVHSHGFAATMEAGDADAGTRIAVFYGSDDGTNPPPSGANFLIHGIRYSYGAEDIIKEGVPGDNRTQLVAAAGGVLYANTLDEGTMTPVSTSPSVANDRTIRAAAHLQKLFVADASEILVSGVPAGATVSDADPNILDDSSVTDWTQLGINTADHVVVISSIQSGGNTGVYQIDNVHATNGLTLAKRNGDTILANPSGSGGNYTCTYRVVRGVKVYDPSDETFVIADDLYGEGFPQNCASVVMFQDRLCWAVDSFSPQSFYFSRRGESFDYQYSSDSSDPSQAISDQTGAIGTIGDDITALLVASRDYLIFGCRKSIWVLRGDPGGGGVIDNISRNVGIVGPDALCNTPEGGVLFESQDGIGYIPPSANGMELISRERIPDELIGLNNQDVQCMMAYDTRFRGAHIFLSPIYQSGTNLSNLLPAKHWWLSWKNKSYWPMVFPAIHNPASVISYSPSTSGRNTLLLGGRRGGVTKFAWQGTKAEPSMTSHVIIGPINMMRSPVQESIIVGVEAELASTSGDVTWELYVGKTPEAAAKAALSASAPDSTGTWSEGFNYASHPRHACGGACIRVRRVGSATVNPNWAIESIVLKSIPGGMRRK